MLYNANIYIMALTIRLAISFSILYILF